MNTNKKRLHPFVSIRVYSWLFSSFKAVAMVWFLDDGIIGSFAKNYNKWLEEKGPHGI
jgi:hypothetical protein